MRAHFRPVHLTLVSLLSFATACGGGAGNTGQSESAITRLPILPPPILKLPQGKDQSFLPFDNWGVHFSPNDGWHDDTTPILFGHVNADAKDDFVGFGYDYVWVGLSAGDHFGSFQVGSTGFSRNGGWDASRDPRLLGDINGDGLDDIVGFGDEGVYTALSNGSGFGPVRFAIADLGYNSGWRVDQHTRLLADVNGDGKKDIVAFGTYGVSVALADGTGGFGPLELVLANFGANQGWSNARHVRTTADLNGDGRADLVCFGDAGVWIALSTGNGFAAPQFVLASFGANSGWLSVDSPSGPATLRTLADVNDDGKMDLVGINYNGVYVALGQGNGVFSAATLAYSGYLSASDVVVRDLNGDGYADVIQYEGEDWARILGSPYGFGAKRSILLGTAYQGAWSLADADGNGMPDLVLRTGSTTKVARSTDQPPPPPPAAPSNVHFANVYSSNVTVEWTDNSNNETGFEVQWVGYAGVNPVGANVTSMVFNGLSPNSRVCFQVRAVNDLGRSSWSPQGCTTTLPATGGGTGGTTGSTSITMTEDPARYTGVITYTGNWPNKTWTIDRFWLHYSPYSILFLKNVNGVSLDDCTPGSSNVIALVNDGSLTAAQVQQISFPHGDGTIDFHGCAAFPAPTQTIPNSLSFNVDYHE